MNEILDNWAFDDTEKKRLKFYKDFVTEEDARDFLRLLDAHEIPYSAEVPKTIADQTFVGTPLLPRVLVKLLPEDFTKANALIADRLAHATFSDVEQHYLNQFKDEELMAVLGKPDEWSIEDIQVAGIILRHRGLAISDDTVRQLREARLQEIRKGRKGSVVAMVFYFFSIALVFLVHPAFFVAGIAMGYYYAFGKTVDLDGNKHSVYEPRTRLFGKIILFGGLLAWLIVVLALWKVL